MNTSSNMLTGKIEPRHTGQQIDPDASSELANLKRTLEATKRMVDEMQSTIADVESRLERKKAKQINR